MATHLGVPDQSQISQLKQQIQQRSSLKLDRGNDAIGWVSPNGSKHRKAHSQEKLYYYIPYGPNGDSNRIVNNGGGNKARMSTHIESYTEDTGKDSKPKLQKVIFPQKDMLRYPTDTLRQQQNTLHIQNHLRKNSQLLSEKDPSKKHSHFISKELFATPYANIFPNSSQKLSKLIGYEPMNPNASLNSLQSSNINIELRNALEKKSLKTLTFQNKFNMQPKQASTSHRQPDSQVMKKFDTFFTTKIEHNNVSTSSNLNNQTPFSFQDIQNSNNISQSNNNSNNQSQIFQSQQQQQPQRSSFQLPQRLPQLFRNITILHFNSQKQHAVESLRYRIPRYNTKAESLLKEGFEASFALIENLLQACQKHFNPSYQLRFLSLLDETPIQHLQDIPLDQSIIVISSNSKDNFWLKYYESRQFPKPSERDMQTIINKLNSIQDQQYIEGFFKSKKNIFLGLDDNSNNYSVRVNSNNGDSSGNLNEEQLPKNKPRSTPSSLSQFPAESAKPRSQVSTAAGAVVGIVESNSRGSFLTHQGNALVSSTTSPNRFRRFATPTKTTQLQQGEYQNSNLPLIKKKLSQQLLSSQQWNKSGINTKDPSNENKKNITQGLHIKFGQKVQQNIDKYTSLNQEMIKKYPLLNNAANVDTILQKTSFNRYQLHLLFSKFKALIEYKAAYRNVHHKPYKQIIEEGVDVISFRRGVDSLLVAPTEQIEKLFQSQNAFVTKDQGGMNWEGFVYALDMIEAKTDDAKIDLFMRLLDEDLSGTISYNEIFDQSNQLLKQLYQVKGNEKSSNEGYVSLDDISHFLTKTIFDAVGQDYDKEILTEDLKLQIRKKNKDLELLLMLCFYNNEQPYNYYSNSDEEELVEEEKRMKEIYN